MRTDFTAEWCRAGNSLARHLVLMMRAGAERARACLHAQVRELLWREAAYRQHALVVVHCRHGCDEARVS